MYEAAVRARNRIDNSLAYTRMQQGRYEVQRERVNVVQLVRDVIHNLTDVRDAYRVSIVATYRGEPLESEYDIELWGENGFLMDAVGNLVRNAVEASSAGDTVTVDVDDSLPPDPDHPDDAAAVPRPAVSIAVHNPAPIPSQIRETLFNPYVTHGKSGGTGLGTYTALMVATAHGGTVTMHTDEEIGTTLAIIVPRGRPEALS
jgi:signal transduction histidine kinase